MASKMDENRSLGALGPDFYDFGRFLAVLDFYVFCTGKKSATNPEQSGILAPDGERMPLFAEHGGAPER